MSLQSSTAVMKAKLAGNVPQLQALAMQGDFEAVAALKEMTDKKAYAQGMANETAMSQEDTLPVLEQMVGNLEAPQSGIAAYASGGRAFADGNVPWFASNVNGVAVPPRPGYHANNPMYDKKVWGSPEDGSDPMKALSDWWARVRGEANSFDTYSNEHLRGARAAEKANEYPEPVQARSPATNKETVRKPRYSGIAAAAAPAETSPPSDGPFDPKKRMQRQEGAGMPALPAVEDMSDGQLRDFLAKQEPLQKKRDELDELSRKQLEAAYNAKVKNLTPSKFDRVMEFLAGVSAKGGSSAAQALGAGALAMHGKDKARKEQLGAAKELYDKADLLIQQAQVERQMGNNAAAYKLEQEAANLQRQIAAQKSTENLQGAQADYYRGARTDQAQAAAAASRARANRPTGIAAGVKPIDPVKRANLIRQEADALAKAEGKDLEIMTPTQREALTARATRIVDTNLGKPAAASPAAPKAYDFGTLMQGQ